jgi:hypothetical protein
MNYYCPSCQRMLANHRLPQCSFCGALIPDSLRFTAEEIRKNAEFQTELGRLIKIDKEWREHFEKRPA